MADNSLITKSQLRQTVAEVAEAIDAIPEYTHPTYTARTGKPTANATPGFGGTFTVSQITSDSTGHVTAATDRTITIPSTAATTSAAGLMSAADKSKLDGIEEGATSGGGAPIVSGASSDGATYTATVDEISTLTAGQMIVFIPAYTSTSTAPTLNINSLGAKTIKRRLSNLSSTTTSGAASNWLYTGKPQVMMYDGTYWIVVNQDKPSLSDLYGSDNLVQYVSSALSTIGGTSISLDGAKIATGSYTGTGTYGSSNPCSLTFDFVPKLLVVRKVGKSGSSYPFGFVWIGNAASTMADGFGNTASGSTGYYEAYVTLSGNTVSWYGKYDYTQMNISGYSYYYAAIG